MNGSINEISQKLGLTKSEIRHTLKRNKRIIVAGALVVVALALIGNLYHLGVMYGGISLRDFKFLSRLRIFQFLFH